MARKRAGGPSKSDLIRTTSAENPTAGPTEVAKLIQTAHNIKVSPAMVSTVLSQDRTRGGKPAKRGRPPKATGGRAGRKSAASTGGGGGGGGRSTGVSVDTLVRVKQLADEMGGVEQARKALDALSQILS